MADYEILELLLTLAIPRRDVKPLAKQLIRRFGNLNNVITASEYNLKEIDEIKDNSILVFKLVKTAAQKLCWQNLENDDIPILLNTDHLIDYCRSKMAYSDVEELHILYLDSKLKVIETTLLQRGSINSVCASPREIIKQALNKNAAGIIMAHNHPSGSAHPSKNDLALTQSINEACKSVNLILHDHIIITRFEYFSFLEHRLLD